MISPSHNNSSPIKIVGLSLLVAIALGIVVSFAGALFGSSTPSLAAAADSNLTSSSPSAGTENALTLVSEIQSLTLDGSIFSNPAFESLQDFTAPITPVPVGRSNPFSPIPGLSAASVSK